MNLLVYAPVCPAELENNSTPDVLATLAASLCYLAVHCVTYNTSRLSGTSSNPESLFCTDGK